MSKSPVKKLSLEVTSLGQHTIGKEIINTPSLIHQNASEKVTMESETVGSTLVSSVKEECIPDTIIDDDDTALEMFAANVLPGHPSSSKVAAALEHHERISKSPGRTTSTKLSPTAGSSKIAAMLAHHDELLNPMKENSHHVQGAENSKEESIGNLKANAVEELSKQVEVSEAKRRNAAAACSTTEISDASLIDEQTRNATASVPIKTHGENVENAIESTLKESTLDSTLSDNLHKQLIIRIEKFTEEKSAERVALKVEAMPSKEETVGGAEEVVVGGAEEAVATTVEKHADNEQIKKPGRRATEVYDAGLKISVSSHQNHVEIDDEPSEEAVEAAEKAADAAEADVDAEEAAFQVKKIKGELDAMQNGNEKVEAERQLAEASTNAEVLGTFAARLRSTAKVAQNKMSMPATELPSRHEIATQPAEKDKEEPGVEYSDLSAKLVNAICPGCSLVLKAMPGETNQCGSCKKMFLSTGKAVSQEGSFFPDESDHLFDLFDKDGDGVIMRKEFELYMKANSVPVSIEVSQVSVPAPVTEVALARGSSASMNEQETSTQERSTPTRQDSETQAKKSKAASVTVTVTEVASGSTAAANREEPFKLMNLDSELQIEEAIDMSAPMREVASESEMGTTVNEDCTSKDASYITTTDNGHSRLSSAKLSVSELRNEVSLQMEVATVAGNEERFWKLKETERKVLFLDALVGQDAVKVSHDQLEIVIATCGKVLTRLTDRSP